MPKPHSPIDDLARDEAGNPDFSLHGRIGKDLAAANPQILRHGKGGVPHIDVGGSFNYDKPAAGTPKKPIVDPTGKAVALKSDDHGFALALQEAAKEARVPVPPHVIAEMATAAHEEAEKRLGDLRSHIERKTTGKGRERAHQELFAQPYLAMLRVGEKTIEGPHLRRLMNALAGHFRDGSATTLPDGVESPIPLPLSAIARHHITAAERRNGVELDHILPEVDKLFHAGLRHAARLADKAARNPHDVQTLQAAAMARGNLRELGAHHTRSLAEIRRRTRDEDAKVPAADRKGRTKALADRWEADDDAKMGPMDDSEARNFAAAVHQLVQDPDRFVEVTALPNSSQAGAHHAAGRTHMVRALEEAAAHAGSAAPEGRPALEVLLAHTIIGALGPRSKGIIDRGQKTADPKYWHAIAHKELLSDRHQIARQIVEGYHNSPDRSLCALCGVDPLRVARRIVGTLPGPDDMLRTLTESGLVKPKAADPKAGKKAGKPGEQKGGIPPMILPQAPLNKAGAWDADAWEATRDPRSGRSTVEVPSVSTHSFAPPRGYFPKERAGGAADAATPNDRYAMTGQRPDDRDQFNAMRDDFHDLAARHMGDRSLDHTKDLVRHGTRMLYGPLAGMREKMLNAADTHPNGPDPNRSDIVHNFLKHYAAMHPSESYDPRAPHRHLEDHTGMAAGRAFADYHYDRARAAAEQNAQQNYDKNRALTDESMTWDRGIDAINRKYHGPGTRITGSGHLHNYRQRAKEAEINDYIRGKYQNADHRQDIFQNKTGNRAFNTARGQMDVWARHPHSALQQVFGAVGGNAMDAWQRHLDTRRAHRSATKAAREQVDKLMSGPGADAVRSDDSDPRKVGARTPITSKYDRARGAARPAPAAAPAANPAAAPPARSGLANPRPRRITGFEPRAAGTSPRPATSRRDAELANAQMNGYGSPAGTPAGTPAGDPALAGIDAELRTAQRGGTEPAARPWQSAHGMDEQMGADLDALDRGGATMGGASSANRPATRRVSDGLPGAAMRGDWGRGPSAPRDEPVDDGITASPPVAAPRPKRQRTANPPVAAQPPLELPAERPVAAPEPEQPAAIADPEPVAPEVAAPQAEPVAAAAPRRQKRGATPAFAPEDLAEVPAESGAPQRVAEFRDRQKRREVEEQVAQQALTGKDAAAAIGNSEDVASHPKLGTYVVHPHEDGYRISRIADSDPETLRPVNGHGVHPTREAALDSFRDDKGDIKGYEMMHPHYQDGADEQSVAAPTSRPSVADRLRAKNAGRRPERRPAPIDVAPAPDPIAAERSAARPMRVTSNGVSGAAPVAERAAPPATPPPAATTAKPKTFDVASLMGGQLKPGKSAVKSFVAPTDGSPWIPLFPLDKF